MYTKDGDFTDETKAKLNDALSAAKTQATTPEERFEVFVDQVQSLRLSPGLSLSPEGELSVEAPAGSVVTVNLNPEYDSAGGLYNNS